MNLVVVFVLLINTSHSANILGVFMFPSYSHQAIFHEIYTELSLRGHQVTVITTDPLNDPTLTNLTEISVSFLYEVLEKFQFQKTLSVNANRYQVILDCFQLLDVFAENMLNNTDVKELISSGNKVDLILMEFLFPVLHAFGYIFNAPVISISTLVPMSPLYDAVCNPSHPLLNSVLDFSPEDLTLWDKINVVHFFYWTKYQYYYHFLPRAHEMAKKYFGDVPYIGDLERNLSMFFVMSNPVMYYPRPNVPAIVEISPFNYKPAKALSKDLQKILDEATEGVVYFSFGTNVKINHFGEKQRSVILQALSELPYKVLLKWDSENISSNIITRKWFPQKDLLAHPNIKVFVTQGGWQSIEDAISREVPLVGIPFAGDQPVNIRRVVELEIGERINVNDLTKDKLKEVIIKVAENQSYKKKIKEVRDNLFDRPRSGLEDALWWCEYVIRHKGANHLRSPALDISLFEYLLLDVISVLVLAVLIGCYIIWKLGVMLLGLLKRNSRTTSNKKKEN